MTPQSANVIAAFGYQHPLYAASLAEFGEPRALSGCGGWILVRPIPESDCKDGMGCYPLFFCRDWEKLPGDIEGLREDLVSVSLVADPFGDYRREMFAECFDVAIPFKEHYVVDLQRKGLTHVSSHHRYYARRALRSMSVEACEATEFAGEWASLYQNLVARHGIRGIKAFSPISFERQMAVPGLIAVKAFEGGKLVGAHLWYVHGDVAYSHLAAATERGYQLRSPYAAYAFALDYFRDKVRWLDLGAGSGVKSTEDGLTQFKSGWATETRPAYFCGRILNPLAYQQLLNRKKKHATDHFPAYRQGEFG